MKRLPCQDNFMLPGKMQLSNSINNGATHDNTDRAIIEATIIKISNPMPVTATGKAGPEGS